MRVGYAHLSGELDEGTFSVGWMGMPLRRVGYTYISGGFDVGTSPSGWIEISPADCIGIESVRLRHASK